MVDCLLDCLERRLDIRKIDHPAHAGVHGSAYVHLDSETVAVEATAFVACRHVGQKMSGLNCELLEYFHGCLLGNPQLLVRLQTQLPLGVSQAVVQSESSVRLPRWTVHWLQKEVSEKQGLVAFWFCPVL